MRVARITRPERYFLLAQPATRCSTGARRWRSTPGRAQYVAGGGDHGWIDFGAEIPAVLRFAGVPLSTL